MDGVEPSPAADQPIRRSRFSQGRLFLLDLSPAARLPAVTMITCQRTGSCLMKSAIFRLTERIPAIQAAPPPDAFACSLRRQKQQRLLNVLLRAAKTVAAAAVCWAASHYSS